MSRDNNIFYNLVTNENSATELLCNLFQFDPFIKLFCVLIGLEEDKTYFEYQDVESQYDFSDKGIPDIFIKNDNYAIMVEIKINNTSLTNNQPSSYLNALAELEIENKYLIFLVPRTYIHLSLINERSDNWNRDKVNNSQIIVQIIYWEDIFIKFKNTRIYEFNLFFAHFYSLLESWYGYKTIPFSNNEVTIMFTNEIPDIMVKMNDLVKEVMGKIKQYYKVKKDDEGFGYGFYIKDENSKIILFFGYWFELWRDKGFPLCIGAHRKHSSYSYNNFEKHFEDSFEYEENWKIYGIKKDIITSDQNTQILIDLLLTKSDKIVKQKK